MPLYETKAEGRNPMSDYEQRLDKLFDEAFSANHPAMLDYINMKFAMKALRTRADQAEKAHDALHKQYSDLDIAMREAEKELAELQGKRNTAYSYIEDVLIGSPYEWAGKRLLEMIGDKK